MKLNLKRPLAFFDLEATGVNVATDRIVEIAILKAMPNGTTEKWTRRVNPMIPIPLSSSLIHGIYDADVKDAPTFTEIASEVAAFFGESDLAGYNSNKFDIPLLLEEFLRIGFNFDMGDRKFVDVQNIFHQMEQRTLKAAYKFYCNEDLLNAHSAEADIEATYKVLLAQIERYEGVNYTDKEGIVTQPVINDVEQLHDFTNLNKPVDFAGRMVYNDQGEACFNFGKHKGKTVKDVFTSEPSYYSWMKQGDFPLYTKLKLDEIWSELQSDTTKAQNAKPKTYSKPYNPAYKKTESKKGEALTNDMLEQLKMKFGK